MRVTLVSILLSSLMISACATKTVDRSASNSEPDPNASATPAPDTAKIEPGFSPPMSDVATEQANVVIHPMPTGSMAAALTEKTETPPQVVVRPAPQEVQAQEAAIAAAPATVEKNVNAELADRSLRWLQNGNLRYVNRKFRGDGRFQADRDRTKSAQRPHAVVIASSDSRVPPELIFDQALGEIVVIRVAGLSLDSSAIASLEQAIDNLGPKLVVVMGNTNCDMIKAALKTDGPATGSESYNKVLADIRGRLKTVSADKPSENLEVEAALNADGVARSLSERSESVKKKIESGEVKVKSAVYWIDSGKVKFY